MSKLLSTMALTGFLLSAGAAIAAEKTIKLSVPDMNCASCPYLVKSAISQVTGVKAVEARLDDTSATVTFDDAVTTVDAITEATGNIGYPSTVIDQSS